MENNKVLCVLSSLRVNFECSNHKKIVFDMMDMLIGLIEFFCILFINHIITLYPADKYDYHLSIHNFKNKNFKNTVQEGRDWRSGGQACRSLARCSQPVGREHMSAAPSFLPFFFLFFFF